MSQGRVFDFQEQLKYGHSREALIAQKMPFLERLDGFRNDFRFKKANALDQDVFVEIKGENYSTARTRNFFIERYSDIDRKTLGGPWQALMKGSHFYAHLFNDGHVFWFKTKELTAWIDAQPTMRFKQHLIRNEGWTTQGITIPRVDVVHLYWEEVL